MHALPEHRELALTAFLLSGVAESVVCCETGSQQQLAVGINQHTKTTAVPNHNSKGKESCKFHFNYPALHFHAEIEP